MNPLPATPRLATPRLVLRAVAESDTPAIQRRFGQWDVVRHLHAGVPWPYPADGAATNMAECLASMRRRERFHWALTLAGDDELIGRLELRPDDGISRDMRGFWLDPAFWGRGLMTEAAERVTAYAFLDLEWPCLWLTNAEANVASSRIKEKQGARLIDRRPKAYVGGEGVALTWLLTREDWLARGPITRTSR